MFRKLGFTVLFALALFIFIYYSQEQKSVITTVTNHTLTNGLFYEIHSKPENSDKIQLRLMVHSGSLSETDAQSGYAHLVEHMAFNGTKNFPKNKIIELFEKSGLTFGHDINAYTNFTETVYSLSVPRSDKELLAEALLYLHDVLSEISFDSVELSKEKGVVENEYRVREIQEKFYTDFLFDDYIAGSKYAQRRPLGSLQSIEQSSRESLNAFYQAWYRPDNAKLLIIGDVDSEDVAPLISKIFSPIKETHNAAKQTIPAIPLFKTASQVYTSKVINFSETELHFEVENLGIQDSSDLSQILKLNLLDGLFNYRLNAMNRERPQPFSGVGLSYRHFVGDHGFKSIYVDHLQGEAQHAITFIAQEIARIAQYGFSQAEYQQQLTRLKRSSDELINFYTNQNSAQLAYDVIDAWAEGNIEYSLQLEQLAYQHVLQTISLDEINQLAQQLLASPRKLTLAIPYKGSKPDLFALDQRLAEIISQPIDHKEVKIERFTLPVIKKETANRNKIETEKFYPKQNITQWSLSNGIDIVLQPDTSVRNSISMGFTAPGGKNILTLKQLVANRMLINSYTQSDIAGLSPQALEQKFANAKASLTPVISENEHGFNMHSINNPQSLELLFSTLYSLFSYVTIRDSAFSVEKKRVIDEQKVYLSLPINASIKRVDQALFPDNKRQQSFSIKQLQAVQKSDVEKVYQTFFSSVNGYKLTIVGDFKVEQIKPLIMQYIANLPSGKRHQFSPAPQSLLQQTNRINDKTNPQNNGVVLSFSVTDSPNQGIKSVYQAELMQRIISQTLDKIVREELSLTYSPQVVVDSQFPGMAYTFVMIKVVTKVKDLASTQLALERIVNDFLQNGITEAQLAQHKKAMQKMFKSKVKASTDREWFLHRDHLFGYTLGSTQDSAAILEDISVDNMNHFIRRYLDPQKTVHFTNIPQGSVRL